MRYSSSDGDTHVDPRIKLGLSDRFRHLTAGPLVIGQSPAAGTTASLGSSVDLTVVTDE